MATGTPPVMTRTSNPIDQLTSFALMGIPQDASQPNSLPTLTVRSPVSRPLFGYPTNSHGDIFRTPRGAESYELMKGLRFFSPLPNTKAMPLKDANEFRRCRILVVENSDDVRAGLSRQLEQLGHEVTLVCDRGDGLAQEQQMTFDLLISDLVSRVTPDLDSDLVRSFKLAVTNLPCKCPVPTLHDLIEKTLAFKIRRIDSAQDIKHVREKIDLELPSDLTLMNAVLEYLLDRVQKLGMVEIEQSNLFVALDEAFVNAVKHGNRNDPEKLLRVTAELSGHEAIFTVEDEGDGFDVREIPDPTDPANLFKSSGRGVLLIYNIMDEVEYSRGGAKLKMVKRPQNGSQNRLR